MIFERIRKIVKKIHVNIRYTPADLYIMALYWDEHMLHCGSVATSRFHMIDVLNLENLKLLHDIIEMEHNIHKLHMEEQLITDKEQACNKIKHWYQCTKNKLDEEISNREKRSAEALYNYDVISHHMREHSDLMCELIDHEIMNS